MDRRGLDRSTLPPLDRVCCGSTDRNASFERPSCAFLRARGDGACDARLQERRVTSTKFPLRNQKQYKDARTYPFLDPIDASDLPFKRSGSDPSFSSGLPSAGPVALGSVLQRRVYRPTFPVSSAFRFLSDRVRKGRRRGSESKRGMDSGMDVGRNHVTTDETYDEHTRVLCEAWPGTTRHSSRSESRLLGAGA